MEFIVIIILIIIFGSFIKFVPANTVIIVDRNSHYLKTKRSGMYLFNPATDKVTTKIPIDIVSDVDLLSVDTEREFIKGIFCAAIDLALTQLNEKERSALLFTHSELTTIEENTDLEEFSTELLTLVRNNIKLWEE